MSKAALYIKMFAAGSVMCIGGPALVYYVSPTEEELFKRYNPDLQKRSLENRHGRQEEVNRFVNKLKEYSRSDRSIWEAAAIDEARTRANAAEGQLNREAEIQKQREDTPRHSRAD